MKLLNLLLVGAISFLFTSCSTTSTAPFSTHHENTWFLESRGGLNTPIFCMANKKENSAEPVCYKADKQGFDNYWSSQKKK